MLLPAADQRWLPRTPAPGRGSWPQPRLMLRSDELDRPQEFLVPLIDLLGRRAEHVPEKPVGDIDAIQEVLMRGILLQNAGDGHVEAWYCVEALGPFGEAIDIREGCDPALSQNGELLRIDLLLAAYGQP